MVPTPTGGFHRVATFRTCVKLFVPPGNVQASQGNLDFPAQAPYVLVEKSGKVERKEKKLESRLLRFTKRAMDSGHVPVGGSDSAV
jgi:hypothetical protein